MLNKYDIGLFQFDCNRFNANEWDCRHGLILEQCTASVCFIERNIKIRNKRNRLLLEIVHQFMSTSKNVIIFYCIGIKIIIIRYQ